MKLSDLFLPKIARSDPEVRKSAVIKEKNLELLKQVMDKDSDPEVRKIAEQRVRELSI